MMHSEQREFFDDETQKMVMESRKLVAQSLERVQQTQATLRVIKSSRQIENFAANTNGPAE